MSIQNLLAIDVHAHYGTYFREGKPLNNLFMTGDAQTVVRRATVARTRLTVVSPLRAFVPRFGGDPVTGNREAAQTVAETQELLQWVVIDPNVAETYEQADEMLRSPGCVGIKIHPEEHGYPIREHGDAIFRFAAERRAVVLTHSGEINSLPIDFVPFVDEYPECKLILAHLGCGHDDDPGHQVRAIQASKRGNLFVDTSSASSISSGLIEWAVREIGAERILYGTDTPLYFAPTQRSRIDYAEISDDDKRLILCHNAERLLNL